MTIKRKACIAGAWEHPLRKAPDKTTAQLHHECARGALADAGLAFKDVDGYFCVGDAPHARFRDHGRTAAEAQLVKEKAMLERVADGEAVVVVDHARVAQQLRRRSLTASR
jgi:hypothetical protein